MSKVYLSLGSNLGNRTEMLLQAIQKIKEQIGEVTLQSAFYDTEPWGFQSENRFVNAAVVVETQLSPWEILEQTQEIERALGRTQKSVQGTYSDRLVDIDILLYDQLVLQSERLTLPHPLMHQRRFVLEPLQEIAPTVVHPVMHQTITELLTLLSQQELG